MLRLLAFVALLGLASCASVSLSTVAELSRFTDRDLAATNGAALRVRVSLPKQFPLDAAHSRLTLQLVAAGTSHKGVFELIVESTAERMLSTGLFAKSEPGTVYVLKLTPASLQTFRALQTAVPPLNASNVDLDVLVALESAPAGASSTKVWVDLEWSPQKGFVPLIDAGTLPLDGTVVRSSNHA